MAKAIWRKLDIPLHSALMTCHLLCSLASWYPDKNEMYLNTKQWFEEQAIAVLAEARSYNEAIKFLKYKWVTLGDKDALQLAHIADCKDFISHQSVQKKSDEIMYSDENGWIPAGTGFFKILLLVIFMPFVFRSSSTYQPTKNAKKAEDAKSYFYFANFYRLPFTKIVFSSLCYLAYLGLMTANVMLLEPYRFEIASYEVIFWICIIAYVLEEVTQWNKSRHTYFSSITNKVDILIDFQLLSYITFRLLAWGLRSRHLEQTYTYILIVATIFCYARLLNVFAISKSLGPLTFVIVRLFDDVFQWLLIFFVFMCSFQVGIFALTRQVSSDPWNVFPQGTFGVAFATIVGEETADTEYRTASRFGAIFMLMYAIIAQIMLVNLLIAMMGSTYASVKDNSDKEWKFYRHGLILEYMYTSTLPPPLNIAGVIKKGFMAVVHLFKKDERTAKSEEPETQALRAKDKHMDTIMINARQRVVENEETRSKNSIESLSEFLREKALQETINQEAARRVQEYKEQMAQRKIDEMQRTIEIMKSTIDKMESKQNMMMSGENPGRWEDYQDFVGKPR